MRNSSGSSSESICLLAQRPWVSPLRLDAFLPSGVRGPVDFVAFSRLALIWASVAVRRLFLLLFFILIPRALCAPDLSLACYRAALRDARGISCMWLKTGERRECRVS